MKAERMESDGRELKAAKNHFVKALISTMKGERLQRRRTGQRGGRGGCRGVQTPGKGRNKQRGARAM
jgi:hypothetical protein